MTYVSSILSDVMQYLKQNEMDKAQKLLDEKVAAFYKEEVKEKHTRISEINRSIAQVNIELKKIEIQYHLFKKSMPSEFLPSIDKYIYNLKKQRAELEIEKRRH